MTAPDPAMPNESTGATQPDPLVLDKETLADLTPPDAGAIRGGADTKGTESCVSDNAICITVVQTADKQGICITVVRK